MSKTKKLTIPMLQKLIREEKEAFLADKKKFEKDVHDAAKKTEEVDADEYADTLEKEVDFQAALKIKESQLVKSLNQIRSQLQESRKRVKVLVKK